MRGQHCSPASFTPVYEKVLIHSKCYLRRFTTAPYIRVTAVARVTQLLCVCVKMCFSERHMWPGDLMFQTGYF